MFHHVLLSEWTKLRTTKSFWWTSALFITVSIGFSALTGQMATGTNMGTSLLLAANTASGLYAVGLIVLSVQAVMIYTTEFRYHYQQATFLATPRRWVVALTKWLLYVTIAALLTFITVLLCFYVAKAMASDVASATLRVWSDEEARRIMISYPVSAALLVTLASGVAMLLRQTAGAVVLLLIWQLAFEDMLALLPRVGEWISTYGPFTNLRGYAMNFSFAETPWGLENGVWYFAVWAFVLLILGVVVQERRDA